MHLSKETITLVCFECGRKVDTPRCDTDPPDAVELHGITCPDCDDGGYDLPSYFDKNGDEVCGDPETFNTATRPLRKERGE